MSSTTGRQKLAARRIIVLAALALAGMSTPSRADDVVIDETISCSTELGCADVYEVKCPKASRYLCADVKNTATFNADERHTFYMSTVGTSPAAMPGVAALTVIYPQGSDGACLTKPVGSAESALKGMVTVTRGFSGLVAANGPESYRLTAFCVSDDTGAGPTAVTKLQDQ